MDRPQFVRAATLTLVAFATGLPLNADAEPSVGEKLKALQDDTERKKAIIADADARISAADASINASEFLQQRIKAGDKAGVRAALIAAKAEIVSTGEDLSVVALRIYNARRTSVVATSTP